MNSEQHIRWKTDAWKNPGFVEGYAARMADAAGTILLKNRVETEIFQRFVSGEKVLDVGIGTGRASLPLARAGKHVTGVDSSQAMLDKCRQLAGGTPIDLLPGDVTKLPFADASFDTVMSLNTMTHFPHWRDILREWRRVTRDGGQVVFDVYSLDHDIAFALASGHPAQYGIDHFAPKEVQSFYLRVGIEELLQASGELDMSVRAIVPYGAFFGSAAFNRFFTDSRLNGHSWDRLLSWVGSDEKLFDFFAFLEEGFVAHLPAAAACRYMAVLEVGSDRARNEQWLANDRAYTAEISHGLSAGVYDRFSGAKASETRSALNAHLAHAPNRFALARILLGARKWNWSLPLNDWIDQPYLAQIEHVLTLDALDDVTLTLIRSLSSSTEIAELFNVNGLALEKSFGYDLMSAILDEACDAFSSSFSAQPS